MTKSEEYLNRALKEDEKGHPGRAKELFDLALREEDFESRGLGFRIIKRTKSFDRSIPANSFTIMGNLPRVNVHMNGCQAAPVPPNPAWR